MARTGKDRIGKRVTGEKQKNDDYYRIRVVMFLLAHKESNQSEMQQKKQYGLSRMNRGSLKILLEKMIESKWIKSFKDPHSKNVTVYTLNKKGLQLANTIHDLHHKDENHPLFDFETFKDVKLLGLLND